ncbi:methylmalonyl-CoA mutase family protein [Methylovirgula sp. 4M-Z18]|uniref:methylmalonyl-CoA mutase family protein n=1 Tax=Methylovirgula sp. 4M-Z18 TaxID=2293567 RepID=UPI000E2F24A2|nr:methylmalonyl-CoA mutase family protein [Methylovirgula sp. 4M-Z18]RFB81327.1 methylmalonyl-CoA mutase [Methylovirgula sp. 4M-Z18]
MTETFPTAAHAEWMKRAEAALKGAGLERLTSVTLDGLKIAPLYPHQAAGPRALKAKAGAWVVAQKIDHPDLAQANTQILEDLENGANGLVLAFRGAPAAGAFGLDVASAADFATLLRNVLLDLIAVRFDAGKNAASLARLFAEYAKTHELDASRLSIDFALDPLLGDADALIAAATKLQAQGFGGPFFIADGRHWHEAGASEAQELALTLSAALATLRQLEKAGWPLEAAAAQISFVLAADASEFLTLAKCRALRHLWARVEEACGLTPAPLRLHAETAWRMLTKRDPWVNILRGTIASFSAGLGGADTMTVLPFTTALGLADPFARRIARNTQTILLCESNLGWVNDPAAGAGGFESLTANLTEKAWAIFQATEQQGGLFAALAAQGPQKAIRTVAAERDKRIARRLIPITGSSEFADLEETPVTVLQPGEAVREGLPGLAPHRDAEAFEQVRARADAILAQSGQRPRVFLANLGPLAAFTARATFAKNFFAAGGIEAFGNDGFTTQEALAQAFRESGCTIACLCSSDSVYAEQALAAAKALIAAGAESLYLAGKPGALADGLAQAGVTDYIFAGCNAIEVLQRLLAGA